MLSFIVSFLTFAPHFVLDLLKQSYYTSNRLVTLLFQWISLKEGLFLYVNFCIDYRKILNINTLIIQEKKKKKKEDMSQ